MSGARRSRGTPMTAGFASGSLGAGKRAVLRSLDARLAQAQRAVGERLWKGGCRSDRSAARRPKRLTGGWRFFPVPRAHLDLGWSAGRHGVNQARADGRTPAAIGDDCGNAANGPLGTFHISEVGEAARGHEHRDGGAGTCRGIEAKRGRLAVCPREPVAGAFGEVIQTRGCASLTNGNALPEVGLDSAESPPFGQMSARIDAIGRERRAHDMEQARIDDNTEYAHTASP